MTARVYVNLPEGKGKNMTRLLDAMDLPLKE
jgi:hypothetical protein